ncbi:hypothetical protein Fcan01_16848 [Folsomia candida]|uniref:Uncharacterized protein n=1 Tax=Folsomia candida TaxID=158441 RepID=A0A226DRI4_FOLCA|nr:hypothetical protein Fcan01_24824 [Folsomia candida]OXA47813.1 hypothetical protein Fcan01_16848 [Folsomia candida]
MRVKVHLYKQLQILVAQINLGYRVVLLPIILCFIVSANVVGATLTFTLKSDLLAHPANFLYPFLAVESTIALFGMGTIAGCVNKRSIRYISKIRGAASKSKKSGLLFNKMARSCSSIKIRFSSNFMAMSTPLMMASFCAKTTTRLLLMN